MYKKTVALTVSVVVVGLAVFIGYEMVKKNNEKKASLLSQKKAFQQMLANAQIRDARSETDRPRGKLAWQRGDVQFWSEDSN